MISITPDQSRLLAFLSAQPVCPTIVQMAEALGRTKSAVSRLLRGLEERGWVRRMHGRVRSVEVLRPIAKPYPQLSTAERRAEARAWGAGMKPHFDALYGAEGRQAALHEQLNGTEGGRHHVL
jgi:repressor LexA